MKKRVFSIIALVLATVLCVGCMTGCQKEEFTAEKAAEMIAGFKTNPTTVSGTWVQDFKLDVDSTNQSFQAFAQELKATVAFEMDLTAGNLYYYAKRTTDAGAAFEEIVAKADGKYYYKSTSLNAIELADEAAALAKIESAFKAITTEKAGWLDVNAFLYDEAWISDYIMLGSTNVPTKAGKNFAYTYAKAEDGLKIDIDAKYVGYTGDSGIVDVGTNDTYTGSKISVTTNGQGHILSMTQNVNNYIEFNITNPPIPLLYTGTRTLTASYGAVTAKKLDDVAMTATTGTVTVSKDANVLKAELFDFKYDGFVFTATKSEVAAGNFIALKVTCGAGFEVDSVKVNGADTQNMNGYYCLMTPVAAGTAYEVSITTKASAEPPATTKGNATVEAANGITYELYDFDYGTFAFNPSTGEIEQGHFIALKITSAGDVSVKVDGNDAQFINGYYCYMTAVEAGKSYKVTITAAGTAAPADAATVTIAAVEHATCELFDFALPSTLTPSTGEVTVGNFIAVKVTCEAGYEVESVTVNGQATMLQAGYYCYKAAAAGSYEVVVTLKAA